jgi:hypothetical protein
MVLPFYHHGLNDQELVIGTSPGSHVLDFTREGNDVGGTERPERDLKRLSRPRRHQSKVRVPEADFAATICATGKGDRDRGDQRPVLRCNRLSIDLDLDAYHGFDPADYLTRLCIDILRCAVSPRIHVGG